VHRWLDYGKAFADLEAVEPSARLGMLLHEYDGGGLSLSIEELRRLFIYAWADGANPIENDRQVLALLRWISPVRDVESYLAGTHIIYTGANGSEDGIRWTLDENVARQEFGNNIVRGEVESNEVLAHLMAGGKNHVLVDPDDIYDVRPV
jgi:hypothetical protein